MISREAVLAKIAHLTEIVYIEMETSYRHAPKSRLQIALLAAYDAGRLDEKNDRQNATSNFNNG